MNVSWGLPRLEQGVNVKVGEQIGEAFESRLVVSAGSGRAAFFVPTDRGASELII